MKKRKERRMKAKGRERSVSPLSPLDVELLQTPVGSKSERGGVRSWLPPTLMVNR